MTRRSSISNWPLHIISTLVCVHVILECSLLKKLMVPNVKRGKYVCTTKRRGFETHLMYFFNNSNQSLKLREILNSRDCEPGAMFMLNCLEYFINQCQCTRVLINTICKNVHPTNLIALSKKDLSSPKFVRDIIVGKSTRIYMQTRFSELDSSRFIEIYYLFKFYTFNFCIARAYLKFRV